MPCNRDLTGKHVFDGSDASGVIGVPTDSMDRAIYRPLTYIYSNSVVFIVILQLSHTHSVCRIDEYTQNLLNAHLILSDITCIFQSYIYFFKELLRLLQRFYHHSFK